MPLDKKVGDKSKQKKCALKQVLLLKPNMILYISEAILSVQTNHNFDIYLNIDVFYNTRYSIHVTNLNHFLGVNIFDFSPI